MHAPVLGVLAPAEHTYLGIPGPWLHGLLLAVAIAAFVWSVRDESVPLIGAIVSLAAVLGLVWLLWRSKERFQTGGS